MKMIFTPLIVIAIQFAFAASLEARTYNLFGGVAKITLPKGTKLEPFKFYDSAKGYVVVYSKSDTKNRVYIQRETIRPALTESKWRAKTKNYYTKLFKEPGNKKYQLRSSAKQVIVEYQYKMGKQYSRDYTKYIYAHKTTQIKAYFYSMTPKAWKEPRASKLRAAVKSLRARS
jgi:hypothetical protein